MQPGKYPDTSPESDQRVFGDPPWRCEPPWGRAQDGYRRAGEVLKPTPLPDRVAALKKLEADRFVHKTAWAVQRLPINVTFTDHVNHVGVGSIYHRVVA